MSKGHNGHGAGGGKSSAEMRAEADAYRNSQILVTSCALCGWSYTGRADKGRELAKGHRRVHHPEIKPARRRRGNLQRFNPSDDGFRSEFVKKAAEVSAMVTREEAA